MPEKPNSNPRISRRRHGPLDIQTASNTQPEREYFNCASFVSGPFWDALAFSKSTHPLAVNLSMVGVGLEKAKIFEPVIGRIPIDVVDYFTFIQKPTDRLFKNKSVLKNVACLRSKRVRLAQNLNVGAARCFFSPPPPPVVGSVRRIQPDPLPVAFSAFAGTWPCFPLVNRLPTTTNGVRSVGHATESPSSVT